MDNRMQRLLTRVENVLRRMTGDSPHKYGAELTEHFPTELPL